MIPLAVPELAGNEWKYIKDCLDTNWVSSVGKYVDMFEQRFAEYLGCHRAVATVNGTSALHLALEVLGIGTGDEVIVSALTFIAPVNVIKYVGATPVFADSEWDTLNMDPTKLEALITPKTKAILPVHIYGHPVDMDPIMDLARKHNLYVVEDATEALGSEYKGKKVGTIGDIGCFSFNGNKIMTTGGGGMLVSNNEDYAAKAKFLCNQAKIVTPNKEFYHPEIGFNYRMVNIIAAMGLAQLEQLPGFVTRKRAIAKIYQEQLADVRTVSVLGEQAWAYNCFWLNSLIIGDKCPVDRDTLMAKLAEYGIDTRPFFTPVKLFPQYQENIGDITVAQQLYKRGINIPSSVSLTNEQVLFIAQKIGEICSI